MSKLSLVVIFFLTNLVTWNGPEARNIRVEYLDADINQQTSALLSSLFCRNLDHVVHLKLVINWPSNAVIVETTDFQRLVFWDSTVEYLFERGTYSYQHGSYIVDGYFIARSGGEHQGVVSDAFEKVDDTKVLLNPAVHEVRTKSTAC